MSAEADERLTEDPLFLACTRPAMVAGVPMEAMGLNLMVTATVFLAAHSPAYLLIAPAVHVVFRAICKHDHNAFRVLCMYVDTQRPTSNLSTYGGRFWSPVAVKRGSVSAEVVRG